MAKEAADLFEGILRGRRLTELAADGKAILYISHVLEIVEKVCA